VAAATLVCFGHGDDSKTTFAQLLRLPAHLLVHALPLRDMRLAVRDKK
jgi:hypothetical protein